MAVKNMRDRLIAFVAGALLGPAIVWAGLETGTYISDLVATNPLSSDLAATGDDHIRLLKSTIKATFPNINNAVTVTDEQLNAVGASGVTGAANPTASVGLSAVNGSATTFLRSDGAPALSQAIAPTWTASHIFSKSSFSTSGTAAVNLSSNVPAMLWNEADGAADNKLYAIYASAEALNLEIVNDAGSLGGTVFSVDRTGTDVDRVTFPDVDDTPGFMVGAVNSSVGAVAQFRTATNNVTLSVNTSGNTYPLKVHSEATAGDNPLVSFLTEANAGTERGSITYNRAGGVIAYNTSSADDLKRNIRPAKSARGVIDCVRVVSHDWKNGPGHMDYWVTAGMLHPCAPWAVTYRTKPEKDGQVAIDLLVPALIKYVQEQDARIAELERRANRRH